MPGVDLPPAVITVFMQLRSGSVEIPGEINQQLQALSEQNSETGRIATQIANSTYVSSNCRRGIEFIAEI